jgi:hypothetical protein
MKVLGPAWPSTKTLAEALVDVESPLEVRWGLGGVNGLEQLETFAAAGIACPEFTDDLATAKQWARNGARVFGRRLHHTQGTDIVGAGYKGARTTTAQTRSLKWIITKKGNRVQRLVVGPGFVDKTERFNLEWLHRDFWVKVIDSVAEYRQHIWDDRAIRVGKKTQVGEPTRAMPVRSRRNNWHIDYGYQSPSIEFTESIRALARAAVAALGYVGGAVDILESPDGHLFVLEVNSAPSLADTNTLGAYVKGITRWVKREAQKNNGTN